MCLNRSALWQCVGVCGVCVWFVWCVCVWCVCVCLIVCDLENSTMRLPRPELGCCAIKVWDGVCTPRSTSQFDFGQRLSGKMYSLLESFPLSV